MTSFEGVFQLEAEAYFKIGKAVKKFNTKSKVDHQGAVNVFKDWSINAPIYIFYGFPTFPVLS